MLNKEFDSLYKKIKNNWDNLAKPLDGLGEFEDILSKIGAIQGSEKIDLSNAALLIFISDNGIIEEGISQSSHEVTFEVAKALGKGYSTASHMAAVAGMKVFPVNVGIKNNTELSGVDNKCVNNGTRNFMVEPAMTEAEFEKAVNVGKEYVRKLKSEGYSLISLGEMGIGNTTTSAAVLAGLMKLSGKDVCGRGAGLSDDGLSKKIAVVDRAISKYDLYNKSVKELIMTVGGFDIAALYGVMLEAVDSRIPVISDGFITGVAALAALKDNPFVKDVVIFSHAGREGGLKYIFDEFDAKPVITADMALGEGTGTCIFMSAIKCALSVYEGNTSFSDINTGKYERFL